jgi:flagellar protein FliT
MQKRNPMEVYEHLESASRRMLEAARAAEWNLLLQLEQECRNIIDQLPLGEDSLLEGVKQHQRRREIINHILADDAEIRDLVEPWFVRAKQFLTSLALERQLKQYSREHRVS